MKAIVQIDYGEPEKVLELKEIGVPAIKEEDVLVRVHSASIAAGDYFGVLGSPFVARFSVGVLKPKVNYVPGFDVAGYIEAVGSGVTRFKPGDEVFGECGGTCAEYARGDESKFVRRPANITFEQAASVPVSALAALHGLRDAGKVQPGQKVLINGSSGGVGTFAVQIAKALGAEVTGVCSTRNVELVRSLGADHVIDYTKEDFTQGSLRYDLILDQVGNHSLTDCRGVLTPQGVHIPNSGHSGMSYVINAFVASIFIRQQGAPFVSMPKTEDLEALKELIETGKITPVIDRTYPLSETPQAMSYVGKGHARGKVVISVAQDSN